MDTYERGLEWHKWYLHLHTASLYYYKCNDPKCDEVSDDEY